MAGIQGFTQLMSEVKLGQTSTDQAAERIATYVRQEVERKVLEALDVKFGLHPLSMIQQTADELQQAFGGGADSMTVKLLREYIAVRKHQDTTRARVITDCATSR